MSALKLEAENFYGNIINNCASVIMIINSCLRIEYINDFGVKIFGYGKNELIGQPLQPSIIPHQDSEGNLIDMDKIFSENCSEAYQECEHQTKQGTRLWLCWNCGLYNNQSNNAKQIICTGINITGHHLLHQTMRKQQLLAVKADRLRSLGEMASGMAHEFNQPLTIIRGAAENLLIGEQRGWDISSEERIERLEVVIDQTARLTELIDHVRSLSNSNSNSEKVPVDCRELLESALGMVKAQIYSRGIEIETDIAYQGLKVIANPFSLEESILALLYNARDAVQESLAKHEGKEAKIYLKLSRLNNGREICIELRDTGTGIDESIRDRIFEPFFTSKAPDRGTGLGLSSAKNSIEEIGGKLELESKLAEGTTIRVTLPAIGEN